MAKKTVSPPAKLSPALTAKLNAILPVVSNSVKQEFTEAFTNGKGDIKTVTDTLAETLPVEQLNKITLAHAVASVANNSIPAVQTVAALNNVSSLRDLALNYNAKTLSDALAQNLINSGVKGEDASGQATTIANTVMKNLFHQETSSVLQRMAGNGDLPIINSNVKTGVTSFFANQPEFNIRTSSIYNSIKNPNALKDVDPQHHAAVIDYMKNLQRVQAVSPDAGTVSNLMATNVRSAHQISEMSQKSFVRTYGDKLGQDNAKLVHANASKIRTRNELALGQMKDAGTATNIRVLNKGLSQDGMIKGFDTAAADAGVNLSWETLFGSTDMCECDDCVSVYSPAAYFVELLQYLRNDNLKTPGSATDISGTVLEKFFWRRPDLGCLELTCENVNTVLPYIDLVNEVLESFIVHTHNNPAYIVETKNNVIDIQNTEDETRSELLSQPQHTNYQAYCILKNEVYPFTLPYHQPIDAIRIFLNSLNTSRYELMKTFRSVPLNTPVPAAGNPPFTDAQKTQLAQLINDGLRSATNAEYLSMTEEEFIILTKNAYKVVDYYNIVSNQTFSTTEYETQIGVKPLPAYYGYTGATASNDLNNQNDPDVGLKFVKKQFLKRTGVLYTDLINVLKTQFINPCYPQGKALTIMESLRFSYSYLNYFLTGAGNPNANDPDQKKRFSKLLSIIEQPNPAVGWLSELSQPAICQQSDSLYNLNTDDLEKWVYCNFEKIGKLIVLEGNDIPYFPIKGFIYARYAGQAEAEYAYIPFFVGTIDDQGNIFDPTNTAIGKVNPADGSVTYFSSNTNVSPRDKETYFEIFNSTKYTYGIGIYDKKIPEPIQLVNLGTKEIGFISKDNNKNNFVYSIYSTDINKPVQFMPAPDSCDITKVVIQHLDGTPLEDCEWDRIHRFIRLWHKLGWTIDETDKAIMALGCTPISPGNNNSNSSAGPVDSFAEFKDDCSVSDKTGDCGCGGTSSGSKNCNCNNCDISTAFLGQLVYVKKLLHSTGLELVKLLTCWNDISTYGDKDNPSLYARLFLTANMIGVDTVFKADINGNYLAAPQKISDHIPVLMAAFNLKAQDISNILAVAAIDSGADGSLNLKNISTLYRYSLLIKVLAIKSYQLAPIVSATLFGAPFTDARTTYKFLEKWGRMTDAGFTYAQLNYVINGMDDNQKPLTPTLKTILQLAKNIYDGLNNIDADPDIVNLGKADAITDDLISKCLSKIYSATVVQQIIAFLDGTTVYTTNAPLITDPAKQAAFDLALRAIPDLKLRIKYDYNKGQLQVKGILTTAQITAANALSADPKWPDAIHRAGNQALLFYNDILNIIFQIPYLPGTDLPADAQTKMLLGDDSAPTDSSIPTEADEKRLYFKTVFLPYLKQQLYTQFLITTLANSTGSSNDVISSLIQKILIDSTSNQPIVKTFQAIKNKPASGAVGWTGYLIPNADDIYVFVVTGNPDGTPPPSNVFTIDGVSYNDGVVHKLALNAQQDPSNLWFSDPIKLKNGKPYAFVVNGLPADMSDLQWKTSTSPTSPIPASVLLPDCSDNVKKAYILLQKASMIINGFGLNGDEVDYLQNNGVDFDGLDFNKFLFKPFFRLDAYCRLRKSLPATNTNLISFFNWAKTPGSDPLKLSAKINELTQWVPADAPSPNDIDKLIAPNHFNLSLPDFVSEKKLLKLQNALYVAGKISMDINLLFTWAIPTSKFWVCHDIAESIQKTMKARYKETDWEQVVKPLNDTLRGDMRDALVSYLSVEPRLVEWGVVDDDSLFEFFLIDTQMDSCMETSRIKQAINSVQLFVQRCFLGLEDKWGVPSSILDRARWNWMEREVLWVANRKVFLYPENWIQESLRDDKSPFYQELESALLQKDINPRVVEDALKAYLYKLDEVADMEVAGLFIESTPLNAHDRIHIVSRTRSAPYFFYYRYFDLTEVVWSNWEKIQTDIPNYDLDDQNHRVLDSGCYVMPIVFNNRLLIFFPQIAKKTAPASNPNTFNTGTNITINNPINYWEIKMGWSEYRNNKWTQKQISPDAINTADLTFPISQLSFFPNASSLYVDIWAQVNVDSSSSLYPYAFAGFRFTGNNIVLWASNNDPGISNLPSTFDFNYEKNGSDDIYPLQKYLGDSDSSTTYFDNNQKSIELSTAKYPSVNKTFYHPYSHQLLGKINSVDLIDFFECVPNTPSYPLSTTNPTPNPADINQMFGNATDPTTGNTFFDELKAPYSIYNWELFFHLPLTLAESLSKSQQFETAMQWYEYIFNPKIDTGTDDTRWWRFVPFQNTDAMDYLTTLFNSLQPNTADAQITTWRDDPFNPHAIARMRPSAYMKRTVMSYLDNLIAWGDYLFTQHTIESINQATQLYIFASHILGKRPQIIPKRGKIKPETYNSLLDKWDAFSNAVVELELVFPFSNQIADASELDPSDDKQVYPNIFGFASSLYFCIPSNPELIAYWDTLDDRLYKIRHCENIEGVFSLPPLWDPPIDPALLVQATAAGLSLDSVLNDLSSPLPNYRFNYLVSKALELCNELKSMGNSLLSIFEKKDGEALSKMRARHEVAVNNLVMEVKKKQVDEANSALEGLNQNRLGPVYRMQHYLSLLGEDLGKIPNSDTDFSPLPDTIETINGDSGLKLIPYEKEEMDKASDAQDWQKDIGIIETIASIVHLIPQFNADLTPLGVGVGTGFGGSNVGNALQAVSRGLQIKAGELSYQSSQAQRKAGFLRQMQDRVLQANNTGFEIKQIDKQILSQQIRINIANQEITNQQQVIDNSNEALEFLTDKYTNEELYGWMQNNVKSLYYQVYKLGYDLAKKAESIYRFERGLTSSNFIQFGYWDASRDGLLAGERLFLGIKQLEAAYQEKRGYDYELTKHISLRQIDPVALIKLRATGSCEFELPEILFDMDFPGHYMRKIKSVGISIPCIVGPYAGVNATLRMIENSFRISSVASSGTDYPRTTDQDDPRFTTVNVPITAIATSSAQNDSGMFELNFKDERYMPFEGAGAISKWSLKLPDNFRQFDYGSITDVIVHMRYTSIEGGDKLSRIAGGALTDYLNGKLELADNEGLFGIFDLRHDYPNEWYKTFETIPIATNRVFSIGNVSARLPFYTRLFKVAVTDVYLAASTDLKDGDFTLVTKTDQLQFSGALSINPAINLYHLSGLTETADGWTIQVSDKAAEPTISWIIVRYTLTV